MFDKPVRSLSLWLGMVLLIAGLAAAQSREPQPPPADQPQTAKPSAPSQKQPEKEITPDEAKQLFQSVDEILQFASKDSQLPIRGPVKRELMSRPQFHDYLTKRMNEDPDTQRFQRTEAVLRKLGLVPRDFDLRSFLVRMLEEQVEGFYDPKTKTMYLLNWVQPDLQEPVLAHELTHALQDQNFDLDKWSDVVPEPSKPVKANPYDIEPDEARAARQSVSEGQAMLVMLDYILAPSGRTVADAPFMADMFKKETLEQTKDSPVLQSAPMYIRDSLLFSYTYGLDFEQQLLTEGGKQLAFDAALRVPPVNTREIMNPRAYLDREKLPPMSFPRIASVVEKNYQSYDAGEIGQFDIYVMLKQFGNEKLADELAGQWRGGLYWVVLRPHKKLDAAKPVPAGDLAVFYLSRWATAGGATRFAQLYGSWLGQRYQHVERAAAAPAGGDFSQKVAAEDKWNTEDGPVYVEPWGESVLVMESFDDQTAGRIRDIVLERPPEPVSQPNSTPEVPPKPLAIPPAASHPQLFLHP